MPGWPAAGLRAGARMPLSRITQNGTVIGVKSMQPGWPAAGLRAGAPACPLVVSPKRGSSKEEGTGT
jgi:hypothetical protein